jgi:hypothetical protein
MAKIVFQDKDWLKTEHCLDSIDNQMSFIENMIVGDKLDVKELADSIVHGHMSEHAKNIITNTLTRIDVASHYWIVKDRVWKPVRNQVVLHVIMAIMRYS